MNKTRSQRASSEANDSQQVIRKRQFWRKSERKIINIKTNL